MKKRFTFVPVLSGGRPLPDVIVDAIDKKTAHNMVWATLTDSQKDNCEYLDCVEIEAIPEGCAA